MPISEKDRDMMRQVAAYFEGTRKAENPGAKYRLKREDTRSINDTAIHFGITRSKVQKMLITMGVLSTPVSTEVRQLRNQGMSIREIAETLDVSVGTVSSNLPYEDEIHGSETPSEHARPCVNTGLMSGCRRKDRNKRNRTQGAAPAPAWPYLDRNKAAPG